MTAGRALLLGLAWIFLVAAAPQPVPVELPPPDLTFLVPIAAAPLDKPGVPVPEPPMPDPPYGIPALPPPPLMLDPAVAKPAYPIGTPDCSRFKATLGMVAALLECGRERYAAGEYTEAIQLLEQALNKAPRRDDGRLGRYWLAEAQYKVERVADADRWFQEVYQEDPKDDLAAYALHSSGWTALRLGDTQRALDAFDGVLKLKTVGSPSLLVSARLGRALALSYLGRHEEARPIWTLLLSATPASLSREAMFRLGETLGRLQQYGAADEQLTRFVAGGAHPLLYTGYLRLGWWRNAAGRPAEAVKAYRNVLAYAGDFPERDWAHLGLVQALLNGGDWADAREALKPLQERNSPLAMPAVFSMVRWAATKNPAAAHALDQELLARGLNARDRAWILFVEGEVFRAEGKRDEARTRYDLARMAEPVGSLGWHARLRLAQLNFEFREFGQVQTDAAALLEQPIPADLRGPALLLAGESAYYAGDYAASITAFRRFLGEFRADPASPAARLSVGWAELRRGNDTDARQIFSNFARELPDSPLAPDAVVLAAELAARGGDTQTALELLEHMRERYPDHPRAGIARLNQGILLLRTGRALEAQPLLRDFIAQAPTSPLVGRAHVALGVALLSSRLPAEARAEFTEARGAGEGARTQLGLGVAALALKRWDEASAALSDARDNGTVAMADIADYGLAAVAFGRGDHEGFKKAAVALIKAGHASPGLLYALIVSAVDGQAWDDAQAWTEQLVKEFPADPRADSALARLGLGAAAAGKWPVANEALTRLREQYGQSAFVDPAFMPGVEAQIETGAVAQARQALEKFVAAAPDDPRAPKAWFMLARVREETGDRAGAIDAYTRAAPNGHGPAWTPADRLRFARLLVEEKRWKEARAELERLIKGDDPAAAIEAAYHQGETFRAEGNLQAAVEYFMTAAYLDPSSPFAHRALLAAAAAYTALKQPEQAAIAYQKLIAQPDVAPELAQRARAGLAALGSR